MLIEILTNGARKRFILIYLQVKNINVLNL